jgi:outer membrane receptor protein involved in Fe transport
MKKSHLLKGAAVFAVALSITQPAFAQDDSVAPADSEECADADANGVCDSEESKSIVVTGSRIARPNLTASVPITTVTADQLLSTGDTQLGDVLNQLPQLRQTFSQANSTGAIGTAGLNLLDLRGMGTARTLVMVNGRRHVTATPGTYRVDVGTVPTELLDRVDVVTGGASSVYGSDAIAGVVNFITKRDYDGFRLTTRGGVTSRGDRGTFSVGAIAGKNFADGRGNIAGSFEYSHANTLLFEDRNNQWGAFTGTPGFFTVDNTLGEVPAGDGTPDTGFFDATPGSTFNIISLGGMVNTVCPAPTTTNAARVAANCTGLLSPTGGRLSHNYAFLPDGTLARNIPDIDLRYLGGGTFGGLGASGVEGAMALPGIERYVGTLMARYEFSPAFEAFFDGKYSHITNNQTSTQPTFINSTLSPTFFLDNPYLTAQARSQIQTIMGYTSGTANFTSGPFTFFRFNNDIGTRSEDHERETVMLTGGARGDLNDSGSWKYEAFLTYGRTETYYQANGNVNVARFNNAANAVRDTAGNIVCRINADTSLTNDDPSCRPINLFGFGAPQSTPDGLAYVLAPAERNQWAEMINASAYVSGDTAGFFDLPGGPLAFVLGGEYRSEDAYSAYDALSASGATFLNSFLTFDPPKVTLKEAFGELRIPLLKDTTLAQELTVELAGRLSDYSNTSGVEKAYNAGVIYSPFPGLRMRASVARAVRTPNLSEAYATRAQTFANNLVDPCSQTVINQNPNRARNCAAAGIPTTITLPDGSTQPWVNNPTSGISGFTNGNPDLSPEASANTTIGAVFQPEFIPGLTLSLDYYDITVKQAIASLTGQAIINRCYDDENGIDNVYCAAVFRRAPTGTIADYTFAGQSGRRFAGFPDFSYATTGPGFISQPFNYQKFQTSGIDAQLDYARTFENGDRISFRANVSWVEKRIFFTSITDPTFTDRTHGELGDPIWEAGFGINYRTGAFDFTYDYRYIGKQTIGAWETQNSHQGRPPTNADAFPVIYYPDISYVDLQVGFRPTPETRFFVGMDNVFDQLPPWGLTGTGDGSGIFPLVGRYVYAGARVRF